MKKFKTVLAALLMVVLGTCMLVACGGSKVGTYKFSSVEIDGKTYKVGDEVEGLELTEDFYKIELKEDGKCTVTSMGMPVDGTWKEDGKKVTITIMGNDVEAEVSGGKMTFDDAQFGKMTLKK